MDQEDNFYTLKGYSLLEHIQITSSMEDYLEMICRLQPGRHPGPDRGPCQMSSCPAVIRLKDGWKPAQPRTCAV